MDSIPPPSEVVDAAEAYDRYASRYDSLLAENRINAYMRREMTHTLLTTYQPASRLLELGCGTGDEALSLASHGCSVWALDPSPKMINVARRKARNHPHGERVEFMVGGAADADGLLSGEAPSSFDGAYSSFALSYEPDLETVRRTLARLIRLGGSLLMAVMNSLCGVELFLSIVSGRPQLAGRRLRPEALHKVGTVHTRVFPRKVGDIVRGLEPEFALEGLRALPVMLPPYYANRPLKRWPVLLDLLERIDPHLSHLPLLRALGDHTVVTMRRPL